MRMLGLDKIENRRGKPRDQTSQPEPPAWLRLCRRQSKARDYKEPTRMQTQCTSQPRQPRRFSAVPPRMNDAELTARPRYATRYTSFGPRPTLPHLTPTNSDRAGQTAHPNRK